jgi:hypothetical protein
LPWRQGGYRNASAAEEMASTAEELSGQSERMQQMTASFKVAPTGRVAAPGALRTKPRPAAGVAHPGGVALELTMLRDDAGEADRLDEEFGRY